jgi:hypothetical protein
MRLSMKLWICTLALGLVTGCTRADAPPPALSQAETRLGCALGVPGAVVHTEDTPDGIRLVFVAHDHVADMRVRANDAAAGHGPGQRLGEGHAGHHGEGGDHGLQLFQAPPSHSAATDTDDGAAIVFAPADPADRERLRAFLRGRAALLSTMTCS